MKRQEVALKMAEVLASQAESGLTKKDFCEKHGISLYRFYYWQRKLNAKEQPKQDTTDVEASGFSAITIRRSFDLELRLDNGRWLGVRTESAEALGLLLEAINGQSC